MGCALVLNRARTVGQTSPITPRTQTLVIHFGGAPQAWAWRAGEPAPRPVNKVKVGKKPGKNAPLFRALAKVNGKTWKMTSGALVHRYAPVEKHGMLGKLVGSVVGNPVTYTYVGRLEAELDPDVRALSEALELAQGLVR